MEQKNDDGTNGKKDLERFYNITSVCKDDIRAIFHDLDIKDPDIKTEFVLKMVDDFTDDDMEWLARKMADDYCSQLFWESLQERVIVLISSKVKEGRDL